MNRLELQISATDAIDRRWRDQLRYPRVKARPTGEWHMSLEGWCALQRHRIDQTFWEWWLDERARAQIIWEHRHGWWAQYRDRGREVD